MKTINDFKMRYDMEQIFKQRGSFILYCIQEFKKQLNSQLKQGIANPRLYENAETIKNRQEWLIFNDPIQQFIDEKIVPRNDLPDQGKHTLRNCRKVKETYSAYVSWCRESNYQPLNSKSFSKQMKQKGYENHRTTITGQTAYWWYDLKLYSDTGSIPQQENNLHMI